MADWQPSTFQPDAPVQADSSSQSWSPSSFVPDSQSQPTDMSMGAKAQDQPSTTSDVGKSLIGNVAPTAAANWAANAISPAATLGSYALQGGMTVGKYAGEGIDELTRLATGQPQATQAEYDENSRQLMNAARAKLGLSPTDNGDLSSIVPTPANLVSGGARAIGTPLYQPKTETGKDVTSLGNIMSGGLGSDIKAIPTVAGALAGTFLPQGVRAAGGTQAEQELAGIAGGLGAGIGAEGLSRSPTVTGGLQETAYNDLPPNEQLTAKSPPLDPVDIIRSHGASQATASNVNGIIGDNLRTMAGNATGYAPNARDAVETMLDQAQNGTEPINNRGQVIKALTHTLGQFDENGNMPVRAALDLKVLANQNYNTGQNLYKGAWGDVRSAADDVLSDHAIDNPEFGDMLHLQRVHNANDVGEAYNNNDTLQKMFGRDDLKNVSDADNGILRSVGTDTQKAANSIVSKVKTPEDYQAVARGIDDPQVRQQFNDAVLRNILPSRGQYLWNTLKNAGNFHFADALENFGKTFIPKLGLTDAQLGIYNAIKNENVNPTRYSVGQTEAKANDIMSGWKNRLSQNPPDIVSAPKGMARPSEAFNMGTQGEPTDYGTSNMPGRYGLERGYAMGGHIPSISEWSRLLHKSRKKGLNLTAKDRNDPDKVNAARKAVS